MLNLIFAMVFSVVPAEGDTRYDAVGAFGFSENLNNGHIWHCAATLVAPQVALLAKHCVVPGGPFSVRFRRNIDGSIGSVKEEPSSFHNVSVVGFYYSENETADAALAYLAEPVTHIASITLSLAGATAGAHITIAGWGREGPGQGEGPRVELRTCWTEVLWSAPESYIGYLSAWGGGPCGPNSNDSGAPVIVGGRAQRVVGVSIDSDNATNLQRFVGDPLFEALAAGMAP